MRRTLAYLFLLVGLAACQPKAAATPTLGTAVPYLAGIPTRTPTVIPPLPQISLPTPTTSTYTVVAGDTFISIAQHTGVSVQALQAANPGVSATALSVGTKLVIPTGGQAPGEPTPTAAALSVLQARCWLETSGGLWCFALMQNNYAEMLEDISAQFALLDSGGQQIASQVVYGLLDIIPAGGRMPLAAHFTGTVQETVPVQGVPGLRVQVLTAIRLLPGDTRYLPVSLENTLVSVDADGRSAEVSGRVRLPGTGTANTVWVLASIYDSAGNVVGVRRWESAAALTASAPVAFDFPVSSIGPEIAQVEFLAEARP
ncbi:MAG: LysM peptidoglycan-binding domain-containing protein [Anaerolineales bacterium]|jgi:murein DD-endopeptidase MepM/ murein hydrolase activator NlpD